MHGVDSVALLSVTFAIALAATLPAVIPRLLLPGVVLEVLLGVIIGPQVLGLAHEGRALNLMSELGLGLLFLIAGFELDPGILKGQGLRRAVRGWAFGSVLALIATFALSWFHLLSGSLLTAVALSTTAVGTLLPLLRDQGWLKEPYGPAVLAAGSAGEALPLVVLSLILAGRHEARTIRVVFELTPDQYALYEQAESRVRAQDGRRLPRAEVLKRMAESVLSQGTAKSRARHQVLVHTVEGSDEAWYETERGVLPVASEVLEEALEGQEVLVMGSDLDRIRGRAADPDACPSTTHTSDSRPKRTAIPNAIIRGVFARAGHRCECCGRKGGRLDVHHRDPVSEGGGNEFGRLELLCRACHTKDHEPDFEGKLHWREAREQALKSSLGRPPRGRAEEGPTIGSSQATRFNVFLSQSD